MTPIYFEWLTIIENVKRKSTFNLKKKMGKAENGKK